MPNTLKLNTDVGIFIIPPPSTAVVEGKKIVLYNNLNEPLTRKIGF